MECVSLTLEELPVPVQARPTSTGLCGPQCIATSDTRAQDGKTFSVLGMGGRTLADASIPDGAQLQEVRVWHAG